MLNNAALKAAAAAEGNAQPPPTVASKMSKTAKTSSTQAAASMDSSTLADIKISLQDRLKTKFNLHKRYKDSKPQQSHSATARSKKLEEEDPYAFPDGDPEPLNKQNPVTSQTVNDTVSAIVANCLNNHHLNNSSNSGNVTSTVSENSTNSVIYSISGSSLTSNSDTNSATVQSTPIAKLYPELAEKLHLPVLSERKLSPTAHSGSVSPGSASKTPPRNSKSVRTINKLQTKIAQNRIKDKLKRSQSVSSSSSQSSPDRKATPVSPVVTMAGNWPSVSLSTTISTSSTTSTSSPPTLSTSSHLQELNIRASTTGPAIVEHPAAIATRHTTCDRRSKYRICHHSCINHTITKYCSCVQSCHSDSVINTCNSVKRCSEYSYPNYNCITTAHPSGGTSLSFAGHNIFSNQ